MMHADGLETCGLSLCCNAMAATVYMRAIELLEADIGSDLVALEPKSGSCFGFNSVAASVWSNLATPKTFDQLRDELLADYDVGIDECSRDLRVLLDDMKDQGLIQEGL